MEQYVKQSSCLLDFAHYTILSVLGTIGLSCYILADTFFVSKGLGTNGLTALNLAIPVYNFIHVAFCLSSLWGMTGVWLTYPIVEALVALLGFVIYKRKNKQKGIQLMKIEENSALLVIDIQQEDFKEMKGDHLNAPEWNCIRNAKRVLDVFRARKLPVIQIKEVHRPDMVDFGRELDGSEGVHCIESSPYTDYADLTYPIEGEYLISKRRYSAFFGTDLEILLKGLHVHTLYLIGGLTDVCIHYTAVDAHQHDYHIKVVTDACNGSSEEAHRYALKAIQYLQRDALITVSDIESAQ